jgi:hypothetical protein
MLPLPCKVAAKTNFALNMVHVMCGPMNIVQEHGLLVSENQFFDLEYISAIHNKSRLKKADAHPVRRGDRFPDFGVEVRARPGLSR